MKKACNQEFSQSKILVGLLSITASIISLYLILSFVASSIRPVISVAEIERKFALRLCLFAPEPVERTQFLVGMVLLPFLLYLFAGVFNSAVTPIRDVVALRKVNAYSVYALTTLVLFAAYWGIKHAPYGFLRYSITTTNTGLLICGAGAVLLCYLLLFPFKSLGQTIKSYFLNVLSMFSYLQIVIIFLFTVFSISAIKNDSTWAHEVYCIHLNAVFHAVVQVFLGKAILVDFSHQYGLYPHLIEPIFRLTGLSVLTFTIFMSLLMAISMLLLYMFLRSAVQNKFISNLGFISIVYESYFYGKYTGADPYFQYTPVRFFPAVLAIALTHRYIQSRSKLLYYVSFVVYSLAVIWNLETGVVVFFAWMLFLIYQELYTRDIKKMGFHLANGFAVLSSVVVLFTAYIYFRYGSTPDYRSFLAYQALFYEYGFMMLPMKLVHPWNMVILVYVIGLFFSVNSLINKENSKSAQTLFFLSVLGIGLFSYYQGRSHDLNLLTVCYPALLLTAIFADRIAHHVSCRRATYFVPVLAVIMFFYTFAYASLIRDYPHIIVEIFRERLRPAVTAPVTPVTRDADFLAANIRKNDRALIISDLSGVYHLATQTVSPLNIPGTNELSLIEEYQIIADFLRANQSSPIVLDLNYLRNNSENPYLNIVADSLARLYVGRRSDTGELIVYSKRIPAL